MGMGIVCLSAVTDLIWKNSDRRINSGAENVRVLDGLPSSKCAGLWQFWDKSEQAVMYDSNHRAVPDYTDVDGAY